MFYNAHAFNQDIDSWDISSLTNAAGMFKGTAMTVDNMDNTLRGWAFYCLVAIKNATIDSPVIGVY
jgi:hypothetical protein